jgi:hypothetical protein
MAAIKFEKSFVEDFGWVTTLNEANAFSLWNNNLGYQGILESTFTTPTHVFSSL